MLSRHGAPGPQSLPHLPLFSPKSSVVSVIWEVTTQPVTDLASHPPSVWQLPLSGTSSSVITNFEKKRNAHALAHAHATFTCPTRKLVIDMLQVDMIHMSTAWQFVGLGRRPLLLWCSSDHHHYPCHPWWSWWLYGCMQELQRQKILYQCHVWESWSNTLFCRRASYLWFFGST